MTLSQLARALSRGAVLARDVNAVRRRRVRERIINRGLGYALGRASRGMWR